MRSMYSPRTMPRHLVWFLDELPKDCIEGSMFCYRKGQSEENDTLGCISPGCQIEKRNDASCMHRPGCHLERTRAIPPRSHLGTIGLLSFRAAAQPVKASPNTTSFRAERVAPTASMHRGRCSRLPTLPTCDSIDNSNARNDRIM
ncbi:hypothetical protein RIF29_02050 [Crotalaria pallida]|uniref:Uncharacterized protein n=1 Tax=Crotalaria pallida TaxID=3830 RepID=A0AAN9IY12_CROPI